MCTFSHISSLLNPYRKVLLAFLLIFLLYSPSISLAHNTSPIPSSLSQPASSHTVTIDSVSVRPDSSFQLAIQTSDLTGADISSFDIVLSYDANLITATGATLDGTLSGSDGAGMTLVANFDTPGSIAIAAAGATAISGSGSLVILTFESLSTEGTSAISFTKLFFNESDPVVSGSNGAVTVIDVLIGDPSLNQEITSYDASLILQHMVGTETLTDEAYTSADASGNGEVTAYDASIILQYATGLITCLPAEASCSSSKHAEDVDAQLSWAMHPTDEGHSASLLIGEINGTIQSVTVDLDLSEDDIQDFTLLTPRGWTYKAGQAHAGTYRILLIGTIPLETDSLITLSLSDRPEIIQASYRLNEDPFLSIESVDVTETPTSYALNQNYPNPFNPSTTIQYALPEEARVTLTIYNLLGQEVSTLVNEVQKAGSHAIAFDASHLASGTYLYRIETPGFTATRQMLLIK